MISATSLQNNGYAGWLVLTKPVVVTFDYSTGGKGSSQADAIMIAIGSIAFSLGLNTFMRP